MNTFHVPFQMMNSRKALAASLANKWFLPGVGSYVCGQFLSREKSFHTLGALVGKLVQMPPFPETWKLYKKNFFILKTVLPVVNEC